MGRLHQETAQPRVFKTVRSNELCSMLCWLLLSISHTGWDTNPELSYDLKRLIPHIRYAPQIATYNLITKLVPLAPLPCCSPNMIDATRVQKSHVTVKRLLRNCVTGGGEGKLTIVKQNQQLPIIR